MSAKKLKTKVIAVGLTGVVISGVIIPNSKKCGNDRYDCNRIHKNIHEGLC